ATYMVLAPEHTLIENLKLKIENWREVETYIKKAKAKSEDERIAETKDPSTGSGQAKTGVELKGVKAVNPATKKEIPIWIADYVLSSYGTGAIMAVPAHDERDYAFAKKYDLPIREVVLQTFGKKKEGAVFRDSVAAVVTRQRDNKVLVLFNKKSNEHEIPGGGRDGNEDDKTTLAREIEEETGYTDYETREYLGQIATNFFAVDRNEDRTKHQKGYHIVLTSEKSVSLRPDEHEDFELRWMDVQEAIQKLDANVHGCYESEFVKRYLNQELVCYTGEGEMMNSGKFTGMDSEQAKWEITKFVKGERQTQYRLRDWLISRQRYWGPPIPMIHCDTCAKAGKGERKEMPGWYAVKDADLPVKLPFAKDFRPQGKGESPLASVKSFYETECPACGGKARRETDVSDTFLDSAWYYLGYLMEFGIRNSEFGGSTFCKLAKKWLPVNMYIGGAEHSVLHLLYVRFLALALQDMKLLEAGPSPAPKGEPFPKFRAHGLLIKEGAKMSKSKGNVVNPDEYIKKFGADALRMYLMFLAPFEQGGDFRDSGILGITRFLDRVWKMAERLRNSNLPIRQAQGPEQVEGRIRSNATNSALERLLHQTIKKVGEDIENLQYNTAISALMILLNHYEKNPGEVSLGAWMDFLKLLAPFAPHIAEELWQQLRERMRTGVDTRKNAKKVRNVSRVFSRDFASIHLEPWPTYDTRMLQADTFTLVIQVNGRVRDSVQAPAGIGEEEAKELALRSEKVRYFLNGQKPKRIIYVPGRLINIVV
ncbi:MAG: class I tRNA ligase family protein, partial [Patescibacteria group bacterium]